MQSLFENTKNFSCPPRAWCVDMHGCRCQGIQRPHCFLSSLFPIPLYTPSDACWLIHSPWPIVSSGTGPCSPRLPISSAWSFNSKTEKCFPKEMSDITSFCKLFILSLAHALPSKFNSLCTRDVLNICDWIKFILKKLQNLCYWK